MMEVHVLDLMNYLFKVRNVSLKTIYELMNGPAPSSLDDIESKCPGKSWRKRDTARYNGGFCCSYSRSSEALT